MPRIYNNLNVPHNIDINKYLLNCLFLVTPFAFALNAYLFLSLIFVQCFVLLVDEKRDGNADILLLLITTLYSAVSFLGFRLYDLAIVILLIKLLFRKRKKVIITIHCVLFFIVIFLLSCLNFSIQGMLELFRYTMSVALYIVIINDKDSIDIYEISGKIRKIAVAAVYYAVMIYIIMQAGTGNIESSLISTNVFIDTQETRLNGFFSDPNKYMSYCFTLLFMVESYFVKGKEKIYSILLLLFGSVISFSRTALLVCVAYLAFKGIYSVTYRNKRLLIVIALYVISLGFICVAFFDQIMEMVNVAFSFSAQVLGRDRTLAINASLMEDNRVLIWKRAIELILEKPILGHGWLAFEELLPYPTHNTVLSLVLDGGLVMLINYIYLFLPLYRYKRWDITMACILIPAFVLDMGNYRIWYLIAGLTAIENGVRGECVGGLICRN